MQALPNFVVIGAAKCGTTSLAHYLDQHPEVQVSEPKEVNYFSRSNWRSRIDWYRSHFDAAVPRRGEASVSYTMFPEAALRVPIRMRELIPEARLIYLVGDPLDRVISQWIMWHTKEQDRGFARSRDAWKPVAQVLDCDPLNPYVFPSRYASRLDEYLSEFPAEQILVLDQQDLRMQREAALARVFAFLNVDDSFASPEFLRQLNLSKDWRRPRPGYARFRRAMLVAGAERFPGSIRGAVGGSLRRVFSEPLERPAVSEVFDQELRDSLKEEADRLRKMTGQSFSSWSV